MSGFCCFKENVQCYGWQWDNNQLIWVRLSYLLCFWFIYYCHIGDVEEVCLVCLSNLLGGGKTDELLQDIHVCKGVNCLGDGSADGWL